MEKSWSASLQFKTKAAGGWGTELQGPPFLSSLRTHPCPSPPHQLQFPEPIYVGRMDEVFGYADNLVRKIKKLTEALSGCVSTAQLWTL